MRRLVESGTVRFIGVVEKVVDDLSTIHIHQEYLPALMGVEAYEKLYVLYWFHLRGDEEHRGTLRVIPRRHGATEPRGVFATHSPSRPNPIGLTLVDLVKVEGCTLTVRGLDALEGSPIVDIKPYTPHEDH
ncbi:tRNA (N6-threonylcarbamoyladenosine(37)-N6)-methyltransferase TrmO [Candidatus Bathyarchaeota archaeon]|nr:tRNA (N6-threonylcarbamoyladenosine(37)-N6)-methyltransferase TrmO [Candidatus Bathyarchaeota archaeon]